MNPDLDPIAYLTDQVNLEDAIQIDITELDEFATKDAARIVSDIIELYYNEEWIKKHPQIKRRLDIELETLRGLLKMRIADEKAHDALLNGISSSNTNASLYRALAEIQKTSLAITKQINDTVTALDNILKGYQMELPFDSPDEESPQQETDGLTRGSKAFIEGQIKRQE